ncbi:hypothetical protein YPPY03_4625, partial [Yersinia pestis PY-03]
MPSANSTAISRSRRGE